MPDELEERLQRHARSFDGLLSLIPAKLYYGEDVSDQWKRKKQTPEQKREAKKQKLDPDNWKSAKDVLDERDAAAKKRKREEDGEQSDADGAETEKPKAEQEDENPKAKKRKPNVPETQDSKPETDEERIRRKKEAKAAKNERKKERKLKAKEKLERQKARKRVEQGKSDPDTMNQQQQPKKEKKQSLPTPQRDSDGDDDDDEAAEEIQIDERPNAFTTVLEEDDADSNVSEDEPADVFSPPQESGISSTSSIQPPTEEPVPSKTTDSTPASDPSLPPPRERLAAALANFRTQRKADLESAPKSRAELLEQRRRQEERRRAEKKDQKRREKEEAQRKQEEEIAARFSPGGSGSLLASPRSPVSTPDTESNNFSFGRIAFDDGSSFDPKINGASDASKKKKGPMDPSTALQAALKKKSRLSGLDADKQERIASQDMWANARKRAAGEKVKDDTSLLKKALKRHEGQKKKSEKEWTERKDGIQKSMEAKQKKRTENLAKRKDEKGGKGKGKKVKRPGFEGSFKGRTGGKKGKA